MNDTPPDLPEVIGLIPMAGQATRISPLPCSKEIYPAGLRTDPATGAVRPKVVSHFLLEKMRRADIRRAFLVLRHGKWDIPAYFGDGAMVDMHLGYVLMRRPYGSPFSLDDARPFLGSATVAFGFPDILFTPEDAFVPLLERQRTTGAAVVLGLWPAHSSQVMDMVEVEDSGRVRDVLLKPGPTGLRFTWLIAVWSRDFTDFQHQHLAELEREARSRNAAPPEISVGHVVQAAVRGGLPVQGVTFENHKYLDIGTPEDLARAVAGWP